MRNEEREENNWEEEPEPVSTMTAAEMADFLAGWTEVHGTELATVQYGDDGLYATTVREFMTAVGGLPFTHVPVSLDNHAFCTGMHRAGHFFRVYG
jgi:hypothetical protein